MTPKNIVIFALWGIAVVLFLLVGLDIANPTKYDFVATGLGLAWLGMIINSFVNTP